MDETKYVLPEGCKLRISWHERFRGHLMTHTVRRPHEGRTICRIYVPDYEYLRASQITIEDAAGHALYHVKHRTEPQGWVR